MNSRKFKFQQYEGYLSIYGKKVLKNLVKIFEERTYGSQIQVQGCYTNGQNKRVLNFGDSYMSPSITVCEPNNNESHNVNFDQNESPHTHLNGPKSSYSIASPQDLLKTIPKDVGNKKDDIRIENDTEMTLTAIEQCTDRRISDNICDGKEHIKWENIFDSQLLENLNVLDSDSSITIQKHITQKSDSIQFNGENEIEIITCSEIKSMKPGKALEMTKDTNSDCKNALNQFRSYNVNYDKPKNAILNKGQIKRQSSIEIQNAVPMKIKNIQPELPKKSFRKQKYTKAVKTWLTSVDREELDHVIEFQNNKEIIAETSKLGHKKCARKLVQTQLTNKRGVMKFEKPRQNKLLEKSKQKELLENSKETDAPRINVGSVGVTSKRKKSKLKFTAPVKSQIPVKDLTYNIINVNDESFKEHGTGLSTVTDREIHMLLIYSQGFCQLDPHCGDDEGAVEGAMFDINGVIYYWKHTYETFGCTMDKIINDNTIICYDGKRLLKYLASQRDINVVTTEVNILDMQIGGKLIDPSNPPENFENLQKLLGFVPEYTVATECVQQKSAWYLTIVGESFVRMRSMLVGLELWNVFVDVEMRVLPIVAEMERRGVRVDTERLREAERACHAAAGRPFGGRTAPQLRAVLYDELRLDERAGLRVGETPCTKDESTSVAALRSPVELHPLPRLISEYRHELEAHTTFLAGVARRVKDGVVSPPWRVTSVRRCFDTDRPFVHFSGRTQPLVCRETTTPFRVPMWRRRFRTKESRSDIFFGIIN